MLNIGVGLDCCPLLFTLIAKKFVTYYGASALSNTRVYVVFFVKVLDEFVRTVFTHRVSKNERELSFARITGRIK